MLFANRHCARFACIRFVQLMRCSSPRRSNGQALHPIVRSSRSTSLTGCGTPRRLQYRV